MKLYKTIGLCLLVLLVTQKSRAQNTMSAGLNNSLAGKHYDRIGRLGVGGSVEYMYHLTEYGGLRLYVAYDWFKHKYPGGIDGAALRDSLSKFPFSTHDISFIPVRIGYQQFLYKDAVYIYAETGISKYITEEKWLDQKKTLFTYALGAGYKIPIQKQQCMQVSAFYNYFGMKEFVRHNYMSLRVAYGLGWSKKN